MSILDIGIIALAALVAIGIASRMASRGREKTAESEAAAVGKEAPTAPAPSPDLSAAQLVAVIAAAIAAESGMAPGAFRITGISAAGGSHSVGGFNTPPWGFVDRVSRQARS